MTELELVSEIELHSMRKPFDVLAEGLLLKNSRGDWIRTSDLLNPIQEPCRPM